MRGIGILVMRHISEAILTRIARAIFAKIPCAIFVKMCQFTRITMTETRRFCGRIFVYATRLEKLHRATRSRKSYVREAAASHGHDRECPNIRTPPSLNPLQHHVVRMVSRGFRRASFNAEKKIFFAAWILYKHVYIYIYIL